MDQGKNFYEGSVMCLFVHCENKEVFQTNQNVQYAFGTFNSSADAGEESWRYIKNPDVLRCPGVVAKLVMVFSAETSGLSYAKLVFQERWSSSHIKA